jgi:hypothetical protein
MFGFVIPVAYRDASVDETMCARSVLYGIDPPDWRIA